MLKEYTCIICPKGCDIVADISDTGKIISVTGQSCKRGEEYVTQELVAPMRNIASSILVSGGKVPLASVRLTKPIPKDKIFDVMKEIEGIKLDAPVESGKSIIHNVCGLDSDVITTSSVEV